MRKAYFFLGIPFTIFPWLMKLIIDYGQDVEVSDKAAAMAILAGFELIGIYMLVMGFIELGKKSKLKKNAEKEAKQEQEYSSGTFNYDYELEEDDQSIVPEEGYGFEFGNEKELELKEIKVPKAEVNYVLDEKNSARLIKSFAYIFIFFIVVAIAMVVIALILRAVI